MSEIKSPFLDSKEGENNISDKRTVSEDDNNVHAMNDRQLELSGDNESFVNNEDEGEIEIKDEGKLLKNIIIVMIILLILSILGLVLYNFIFNKKNEIDKINQQATQQEKQKIGVDENTFEMEGKNFKAGSVVIE